MAGAVLTLPAVRMYASPIMIDQESKLAWILALAADRDPERVAETHGVVVGLLCARPRQDETELATHLASLQVGDWDSTRIRAQLGPALAVLKSELASPEIRFEPLLPTDDRPLAERTCCMAHWCSGFLAGFGAGQPVLESPDASEALGMIEQIARAATDPDADQEAEESAFTELSEFLRVAVLLLREDALARHS